MKPKKPKMPKRPRGRKAKQPRRQRQPKAKQAVAALNPNRPPAGAAPAHKPRPANNTTCDVYLDPNVPPAAADSAAVACHLSPDFRGGSEGSEGDVNLRWTHVLSCAPNVDVRDSYPNNPVNRVYVPDKTGTGFDVVFVELVGRGQADKYKRVFLDRRAPTFPTNEL